MRFISYLLLISLFFKPTITQGLVRFSNNVAEVEAKGPTGDDFALMFYDSPINEASGEESTNPWRVYIPINFGTLLDNRVWLGDSTVSIPTMAGNSQVRFSLDVQDDSKGPLTNRLFAVVDEGSGDFRVIQRLGAGTWTQGENTLNYTSILNLSNICNDSVFDCTPFQDTNGTDRDSIVLYFALFSDDYSPGDTFRLNNDETDGVYLELNFSDLLSAGTIAPVLNDLRKADERLIVDQTRDSNFLEYRRTLALFEHGGTFTAGANPSPLINADESNVQVIDTEGESGDLYLNNLENNTSYSVGLFYQDKYRITSVLSNIESDTPLKIENLLADEACYILSAGFQKKHFIVNYFKMIRDKFLKKFLLGRLFINFYYDTAPSYAISIYKSPILSFFVRIFAYFLFCVLNVFSLYLLFRVIKFFTVFFRLTLRSF